MRYVGLDVHQRMTAVCILDENGKKEKSFTFKGHFSKLEEDLAKIPRPFRVCFEASAGYGFLHGLFSQYADKVVVAHPGQLRLIFRSKRKNDRVDAEKLAKILYLDQVPAVHVPSLDIRDWRDTITFRNNLVGARTATKNRLRGLLKTHGIEAPNSLWNKRGLNWLENLNLPSESAAFKRDLLLDDLHHHNIKIKRAEGHLATISNTHPGVKLLQSIPGIGIRTAEAMTAWIDQPGRFTSNKSIGSYFGLVPCEDTSAGKERLGHITQQGPALVRKFLAEAAWQAIRRSPEIRRYFERVQAGNPKKRKKIALIATAHYLARVMLAMLQSGQGWNAAKAA